MALGTFSSDRIVLKINKNNKGKRSQHLHVESASVEGFRVGIRVACNHLSSCLELLSGNEKGQGKTDSAYPVPTLLSHSCFPN